MIRLVNFLLLEEKIIEYNKDIIDKGTTPQKIYELCSCIRETFCISYSIRKDNNLFLYFQKEHTLVSFIGKDLRYLGPDERSQALLLEKALNLSKRIGINLIDRRKQSTPGIYISRFFDNLSFLRYLKSLLMKNVYLITNHEEFIKNDKDFDANYLTVESFLDDVLFILPNYEKSNNGSKIDFQFKEMKNIKSFSLSKIKQVENKILYINYRKDRQESVRL